MSDLTKKMNELSERFQKEKAEGELKAILNELYDLDNQYDVSHIEKIVLLINQCILLDALNIDSVEIVGKDLSRRNIVEQIQVICEEFVLSSIVNETETKPVIAFKENITYLIALILYKVHDYEKAHKYFIRSREFSNALKNGNNKNGLNLIDRIRRDIHFAYCCEYIGTPKRDCETLIMALKILLGDSNEENDASEYWDHFKDYCYDNTEKLEEILRTNANEEKAVAIIRLLLTLFDDATSVFARLIKLREEERDYQEEYCEAVHALSHCLNEVNLLLNNDHLNANEMMDDIVKQNLVRMIVRICIDSLGEKYGTCQAIIRAEQGNGLDAILKMHEIEKEKLSECDCAELDFYQFYFESLFPYMSHAKLHTHGKNFYEFCKQKYNLDPDNYQDGILHYSVVLLKNQLKDFLNDINDNDDFFKKEKKLQVYNGGECYKAYEELRKCKFSPFVNVQMIYEREKLITVYKILRNFQDNQLPLFHESGNFGREINKVASIDELYDLCKKFNDCFKETRNLPNAIAKNCRFCVQLKENKCFSEKNKKDVFEDTGKNVNQDEIFIYVDGLKFDFYGDIEKFETYLKESSIDYTVFSREMCKKENVQSKNKIIYYDSQTDCAKCCDRLIDNISDEDGGYHIFYVGDYDDDFEFQPIAAFSSIDLCFLMAYVYGSIELIYNYLFDANPMYIIVPLRNVSNYKFQEATFSSLLKFPEDYVQEVTVQSRGMGIQHQRQDTVEDYYKVDFKNDEIKKACVCLIKQCDNRLYVWREDKLIQKNVYIGLVNKMYEEYANARIVAQPFRHLACDKKKQSVVKCKYFYEQISDKSAFSKKTKNASKKLLHFLYIACEEEISSVEQCYLLQAAFTGVTRTKDGGFQICIFNQDISKFIGNQVCLEDVVTVTKQSYNSENLDSDKSSQKEEKEDKDNIIKHLEEVIAKCDKLRKDCEYKSPPCKDTMDEAKAINEECQFLLEELKNEERVDLNEVKNKVGKLEERYNKLL